MSYILLVRVTYCLREPDGGITEESEVEEYDGDEYETLQQAEEALERGKRLNPHAEIWISERG